jgi:cytochrome oxidase Cu insertion factor (SCO1/SenC/PrrC family)
LGQGKRSFYVCLIILLFSVRLVVAEKIAPDFTLTDIDGVEFSLSGYRGEVVLLDFFSIRCSECITEIPHLKAVHEEFGEDLIIISISVTPEYDTVERLQQYRQEHEIDWIIARDTVGVGLEDYFVRYGPTIVIVDQSGFIRYIHEGLVVASTLSEEVGQVISHVLTGDINGDGTVNIVDISIVAFAFGSEPGNPNWRSIADLNNDEEINILDIAMAAVEFGRDSQFNFLLNPSLEIGGKWGENSPEYWKKGDVYRDVGAVHTWLDTGHAGSRSAKVSITYNNSALDWHGAQWYQFFEIQYSPFEIGSRYLFRFWYKSSINCHIYTSFRDDNGQQIGGQSAKCETATTWTPSQWLEFTVPPGTHEIVVGIYISNSDAIQETDAYAIGDDFELVSG